MARLEGQGHTGLHDCPRPRSDARWRARRKTDRPHVTADVVTRRYTSIATFQEWHPPAKDGKNFLETTIHLLAIEEKYPTSQVEFGDPIIGTILLF